jgi:ATP-dependent DNA helicase RecG
MQTEPTSQPPVRRSFFDTRIEFLKGVGPQKAALINTELRIFTYGDLIQYYPFRHEDRTKFYTVREMYEGMPYVQMRGKLDYTEETGEGHKKRLIGYFLDSTGEIELLWFQGIQWQAKNLKLKQEYVVFGKPQFFNGKFSIVHPEMELYDPKAVQPTGGLQPVYNLTEKLRKKFVSSKQIAQMVRQVLDQAGNHLRETLPEELIQRRQLVSKMEAMESIHFPKTVQALEQAKNRLKFEELFYIQLKLLKQKLVRKVEFPGQVFRNSPEGDTFLNVFYRQHIPFELTDAQKRVIREIYRDMSSGKQMNRLLQGDVGSGKTIVAFICMLMAIDNGAQACLMAPTEILADQHYNGLKVFADMLGIRIGCLTGSTRAALRRDIHQQLQLGMMKILVGTHALLEDVVQFKNLGLAVIDEQHRFGVAQRARLWQKNDNTPPHVLVMTATPIPRTLAMTLYGDLDVSVIDQLPAGRKPIKTVHRYDAHRLRVFGFIREQLQQGRQAYLVYPLIEESEKMSYKNLMDGYESVARAFPEYQISIVHGQMSSGDKDFEMQRFLNKETHIMVATTVIEVGVNVPNASVMVVESAEKFGLAQLHQLRGRVGRGADQSYCILITDYKLSKEARTRIETMVRTTDGFEISEVDLQLRGPGDLSGTQQSGVLDLLIADLAKDQYILQEARDAASQLLENDPDLTSYQNQPIRRHIESLRKEETNWSRIS